MAAAEFLNMGLHVADACRPSSSSSSSSRCHPLWNGQYLLLFSFLPLAYSNRYGGHAPCLHSVPRLSSSLFPVIISYEQLTILSGSGGSACTSTRPAAAAAFLILLLCLLVITTTTSSSTGKPHRNAIVVVFFIIGPMRRRRRRMMMTIISLLSSQGELMQRTHLPLSLYTKSW